MFQIVTDYCVKNDNIIITIIINHFPRRGQAAAVMWVSLLCLVAPGLFVNLNARQKGQDGAL
jgi:hypothetical protein